MRLVQQAHEKLHPLIKRGDAVIDATVGNGFDTVFLAERVGLEGRVYGFDVQPLALEVASMVIKTRKCDPQCTLFNAPHQEMMHYISPESHGKITAVMFNLGYLPHGDKSIVTHPESTIEALGASLNLLQSTGIISILSYRGHQGGQEEFDSVCQWIAAHSNTLNTILEQDSEHPESIGPYLWILQKR